MSAAAATPRLRFAPSPTGPLHIGGARTALYNWAAARAMGGKFLLRIEDTDQARSTEASLRIILEGLRWLGMEWDEGPEKGGDHGPYFQMQRLPLYRAYAERLLASAHAYECYCTAEEVDEGRAARVARGDKPMYDRRCRDLTEAERKARRAAGREPSIRWRMPLERVVAVDDLCRGHVEVNTKELDDWVMLRPDGVPLYNFACVVDDREMRITHVVRGEEHFLNGIKQVLVFEALDAPPPLYAHIPLILGKDGKKLSKRDASTNLLDYRDQGYPADALFNYIALLGWGFAADRDVFTRAEMVQRFRIEDVGQSGARFDPDKLLWMCGDYIRRMPLGELVDAVRPFLVRSGIVPQAAFTTHADWLANVVACEQERIRIYSEMPEKIAFLLADPLEMDEGARKSLAKDQGARDWLAAYADLLAATALPPSYPRERGAADRAVRLPMRKDEGGPDAASLPCQAPVHLEQQARELAERLGIKFGQLVHPVRAALTGTTTGPGLFEIVFLLGKERAVERLRAAVR